MKLFILIKDNKKELLYSLLLSISIYIVLALLLYTVDHIITPNTIQPLSITQCLSNTFVIYSSIGYAFIASYIYIVDSKTVIE